MPETIDLRRSITLEIVASKMLSKPTLNAADTDNCPNASIRMADRYHVFVIVVVLFFWFV